MCKQWVAKKTFFHCDECQTFDACEACVAKGRPGGPAVGTGSRVLVEEGQSEPYVTELADGSLDETDAISDSEPETEGDDAESEPEGDDAD